jgi:ribonuclease P protein component
LKKFDLSANEKLKSRKDIEELFSTGNTLFSSSKKIKAIYLIDQNPEKPGIRVAVAVSRKSGKAIWRNRVKRLLRESYGLNKQILLDKIDKSNFFIKIILAPYSINMRTNKKIYLKDLMPDVIDIMSRISIKI